MSQLKAMFEQAVRLRSAGKHQDALELMEQIAKRQPNHPMVAQAMAALLFQTNQLERALYHAQVAVAAAPKVGAMHQTLASVLSAMDRIDEAEKSIRTAIRLEPMSFGALNTLGIILARTDRPAEATETFERAMALYPDRHEVAANCARLMIECGRVDEAVALTARALKALPNDVEIRCGRAFIMNYLSDASPDEVFEQHVELGRALETRAAPLAGRLGPVATDPDPDRPLRIGYLSADFCSHSVIHFVQHLIERRDRSAFRVHLYHNRDKVDNFTRRCRDAADDYKQVHTLDDETVTRLIRDDKIDILVDLGGLTLRNRMGVLALRGAPVQVTYCGYCNTTGIPTVDWRVIDGITDPASGPGRAVERLLRLDRCFLCYRPSPNATEPALVPGENDAIVYGSFNAPSKLSTLTLDMWARILQAEPRARLLIKGLGLDTQASRSTLEKRLDERGIDSSRYEIVGWVKSQPDHFNLYHRVHVALDTTPYSGTTTTCEALWMGVPVVTLRGDVHASRVTTSLLTALGRTEWITDTPDRYVELALALGRDQSALASLRTSLRGEFERSPLRDEEGHVRAMESAYREMWRAHCAQVS